MTRNTQSTSSAQIDARLRGATAVTTITVGAFAAVLSYAGLHDMATDAGISSGLAVLLPLCIDGLIVVGALTVLGATLAKRSAFYGWVLTLMGISLSVYGNAITADTLKDALPHAVAPISLALCIEGAMLTVRRRTVDIQAQERAARAAQARSERLSRPKAGKRAKQVELDAETLETARTMRDSGASFASIADALPHRYWRRARLRACAPLRPRIRCWRAVLPPRRSRRRP